VAAAAVSHIATYIPKTGSLFYYWFGSVRHIAVAAAMMPAQNHNHMIALSLSLSLFSSFVAAVLFAILS
jgi:hypothetical protein